MNSVASIAIAGPMTEPYLKVYSEYLKHELLRLRAVRQVHLRGFPDRQSRIALDAFGLCQYGLSVADVARIVERQRLDLPAGTVETRGRDVLVCFVDEREAVEAFEDLVILSGEHGAELRLGTIATLTVMAAVELFVEELRATAPPGVEVVWVATLLAETEYGVVTPVADDLQHDRRHQKGGTEKSSEAHRGSVDQATSSSRGHSSQGPH